MFVRKPGATSPYCVCYCPDGFFLTYNIFGQRFFKAGEPLRCIIAVIPYWDTGILRYHICYIVCCKSRSISAVICTERFFLLSEFQRKCEILIVYRPYFFIGQLLQLFADAVFSASAEPYFCRAFVNKVDSLVGQKAVVYIPY